MSITVQSVPGANPQGQTQAAAPAKPQPATTPSAAPQDKVTISESAKQALAGTNKPSGG